MMHIFYKVDKHDIVLIKAILEAYENIFIVSTVDESVPKIQITLPKDFLADAEEILSDLATRFFMEKLDDDPHVSQGNFS